MRLLLLVATLLLQAAPAAVPLGQNFPGMWAGQLEYRDYTSGERTFLPTWVETTAAGDAVSFAYTYDDGPGKTVRERLTLSFSGASATVAGDTPEPVQSYSVSGLEEFRKVNRGVLTLTGPGKENGKAVDVRITLTLRRNLYTWLKETRAAGTQGAYQFRDQYTMTRASPPGV